MTKEDILGMITLTIKYKNPKSIMLKYNLLRFCRIRGKIGHGSFAYTIIFRKSIIPIGRLWDMISGEAEAAGKTDKEVVYKLNELILKYHFPRYCLAQCKYVSPENGELKDYPMSKEEKEYWYNMSEEKV